MSGVFSIQSLHLTETETAIPDCHYDYDITFSELGALEKWFCASLMALNVASERVEMSFLSIPFPRDLMRTRRCCFFRRNVCKQSNVTCFLPCLIEAMPFVLQFNIYK